MNSELFLLLDENPYRFRYLLGQLEFNVMERYPKLVGRYITMAELWVDAFQAEIVDRNLGNATDYRYQQLMMHDMLDGIDLHEPMQDRLAVDE